MTTNQPLEEDAAGSDFRKAIAFVYIGLVWILAFVVLGWVIHRKVKSSQGQDLEDYEGQAEPEGQAEAEAEGQPEAEG